MTQYATKAQLVTANNDLMPDNATRDISEQDMRDVMTNLVDTIGIGRGLIDVRADAVTNASPANPGLWEVGFVGLTNGTLELWTSDGTTGTLRYSITAATAETASHYTIPAATAAGWVDSVNPTDAELTTAYDVQRGANPTTVGDWVQVQGTTDAWQRLDGGGDGTLWKKDTGEASTDARTYFVAGTVASDQRLTPPVPADVSATQWGVGSEIHRALANGIRQVWLAASTTTAEATVSEEIMPDRSNQLAAVPTAPMPTPDWQAGDTFWSGNDFWQVVDIAGELIAVDNDENVGAVGGGSGTISVDDSGAGVTGGIDTLNFGTNLTVSIAGGVATINAAGGSGSTDLGYVPGTHDSHVQFW